MTLLGASLVLAAAAGAIGLLARLSRRAGRPWAVLEAVLLGPGASRRTAGVDLRFASFAAAVGVSLVGVATLPAARALPGATLGFALLLGLPALVGALAVLADGCGRAWAWAEARRASRQDDRALRPEDEPEHEHDSAHEREPDEPEQASDWDLEVEEQRGDAPTLPPPSAPGADRELLRMLEEARAELATARELVRDPALLAALDALEESAVDYSHAAAEARGEDDQRVREMRARVEGVIALTRSCLDEDRLSAARLLGVRPDATPDEVRDVTAALRGVYGTLRLPGIDPGHLLLLERACERMCEPEPAARQAA